MLESRFGVARSHNRTFDVVEWSEDFTKSSQIAILRDAGVEYSGITTKRSFKLNNATQYVAPFNIN